MIILRYITTLVLISVAITLPRVGFATNLATEIEAWQKKHELPGMVTLILHNAQEVFTHAAGAASMEDNRAVEIDSLFRLFSMTKPITSAAVMLLVEDGAISLDDDIRQHLPTFKPFQVASDDQGTPHTVTVRQLLTHTAGFAYGGNFRSWDGLRYLIANPLSRSNTLQELVDSVNHLSDYRRTAHGVGVGHSQSIYPGGTCATGLTSTSFIDRSSPVQQQRKTVMPAWRLLFL